MLAQLSDLFSRETWKLIDAFCFWTSVDCIDRWSSGLAAWASLETGGGRCVLCDCSPIAGFSGGG